MPDYAGAILAIKQRLVEQWVTDGAPSTPIFYANESAAPFPPIDGSTGRQAPCIVCEVASLNSAVETFGAPGNRFYKYDGLIILHVIVEAGGGTDVAHRVAVNVGEIFRNAQFYDDANGSYVRTEAPEIDSGGPADIEGIQAGNSWRITSMTPFSYYHRA